MSAAASTPAPTTQSGLWPHSSDRRGCLARLIGLVRNLIGYGRELAAALQARGLTDRPAGAIACFGTRDIALILSRIAVALLRADALEAKLLRAAARPDPKPATPRMSSERSPRAPRLAAEPAEADASDPNAPAHAGADRRRNPPQAGRRRDCRYLPRSRHRAEPSAVAGSEPGGHPERRRSHGPLQGRVPADTCDLGRTDEPACRSAGAILAIPRTGLHGPALNELAIRPDASPSD